MPDTPLNPDALEAMSRQVDPDWWQNIDNYPGDIATPRYRKTALDKAERYACAYLAAALPEVTSVEELEALPVGTVVYASNHIGPAERFDVGWMGCGNNAAWSSALLARDGLPARVLYHPEVKP